MNYRQQVEHYKEVRWRIQNAAVRRTEVKVEEVKEVPVPQPLPEMPKDPRKEILKSVAEELGVTVKDILGHCKRPVVIQARWKATWLIYQRGTMSIAAIAKFMNKDHTSILYALKKYNTDSEGEHHDKDGTR